MEQETNKKILDQLADHEGRLKRLENTTPTKKKIISQKSISEDEFSGPKGGVLLLISKGVFSKKKSVVEVIAELENKGYIGYKRQVVQNALNRLAKSSGPLIASTDKGVRVYVRRK